MNLEAMYLLEEISLGTLISDFSRDTDFSRDIFSLADGLKEVPK